MNIEITTIFHGFKDEFIYHIIDKNNILVERVDIKIGWWFNLIIEILDTKTEIKTTINVGDSKDFYYKIVTLNFNLYEELIYVDDFEDDIQNNNLKLRNGKLFDSTLIKEDDIEFNNDDIIITISSIIYVSNNIIDGSENRSIIPCESRYKQTLYSLKKFIKLVPNAKIILLEQSLNIPEEKVIELLKYCDYIISYKNDENNNYFSNIQKHNKGLGELYVTQHFCELIKNKKFNLFCKAVGRYTPTSKFNINDFINEYPTVKVIKANGRLEILCFSNFYSIPNKYFKAYLEHHKIWLAKDRPQTVEHILTTFMVSIPNIKILPILHIKGIGGMNNSYCYL